METKVYSISTCMCVLSGVWFFVTSGTVAWQAPLSLPLLPSGDLHNPEIKPVSPALAGRFFTAEPLGKPYSNLQLTLNSTFYIKKKKTSLLLHCSQERNMGHQQLYWSHPREFSQGSRSCQVCSNQHGLVRKYSLNMCRQCFRQYAKDIGLIKLD